MTRIRRARKKDAPKVYALIEKIMKSEFDPGELEAYPMDDVLDLPDSYQGEREAFFVISNNSQKIIATCGIKEESEGVGLLRRLFVDETYREKGLGEKMIRESIRFCRKKKYRTVTVRTTSRMKAALGLLLKMGFQDRASIALGKVRMLKLTYDCHQHKNK